MFERIKNWRVLVGKKGSAGERVAAYRKELRRMSKSSREKAIRAATELLKADKELRDEERPRKPGNPPGTPTASRRKAGASKKKASRKKKVNRG
jgi:hypothetical protein